MLLFSVFQLSHLGIHPNLNSSQWVHRLGLVSTLLAILILHFFLQG